MAQKKIWIDPKGMEIPADRITALEKMKEKAADKLLKQAQDINNRLAQFKELCKELSMDIYEMALQEKGVNPADRKGNFTFYNFDETTKIETQINERIAFDDLLIEAAKAKFDEFLHSATSGVEDSMIRTLISDAFNTSRGKLDVKRIMSLIGHKQRVSKEKYPLFHEAVGLIEDSIRRPDTKTYFKISVKDNDAAWVNVQLNFSAI